MNIDIFDISSNGEGIGRADGKIVFVPHALPGESVEADILEDKGRFARAQRTDIELNGICGGCPLIDYAYEKQLAWKEKRVRDCLERIAKLSAPLLRPIIIMEKPYAYRNKCEFTIGAELPMCNINCKDCPIQNEETKKAVADFRKAPTSNAERLIVRTSGTGGHMAYTVNKSGKAQLFSGSSSLIDHIESDMGRLKIEIDPFSFYQVNPLQGGRLYSIVQRYAAPSKDDTVLDLYCGCGSIGLSMAKEAGRIIGVEVQRSAVELAARNAAMNGIENASFICGRAEDVMRGELRGIKADTVILDPPRAGCKAEFLESIEEISPDKIVYVSCDPSTLARDIGRLQGYEFVEATPVDMFPHTTHVECIALIQRVKP